MQEYYSVKDFESETIISRSRFITKVFHIESEEQATDILKSLKKQYSDATHICYGYVADRAGLTVRFSDAGEPSGTAGAPIIEAVIKQGIKQVLVAVVRYFGGIKLGGGGLVRAYGGCAATALTETEKVRYVLCDIYKTETDFSLAEKIKRAYCESGKIIGIEYGGSVVIATAVPADFDLVSLTNDLSGGKAKIEKIKTEYIIY